MADNLNGKVQVQGEQVPDGGSIYQPVVDVKYVKGAPQPFPTLAALVAFHPKLMTIGMSASVIEPDDRGVLKATTYVLMADPAIMYDPQTLESKVDEDTFDSFWIKQLESYSNFNRVQEYSPDAANGAKPPADYEGNPSFEVNWTPVYDASKGHKWLRFRDDDVDANEDGIFDNWTVPIALGASIAGGDYVANAYARKNITATVVTDKNNLLATNLPAGDSGHYQILVGDVDVDDAGVIKNLTVGRYFKYDGGKTYTFNNSASVVQTLPPPVTTINGHSNDAGEYSVASGLDSVLYSDDIPAGTEDLWEIIGQKSVYSALKSDWAIRRIEENASLTRFAIAFTDLPATVCDTTQDAGAEPYNQDLKDLGWEGEFIIGAVYLATRTDLGGGNYSVWNIQKVIGESGEFNDKAFKLFPITTDWDQQTPPAGSDAVQEGWSDTPLTEIAGKLVNGVTESVKFNDRTLKIPWSVPQKYTGQDAFNDVIVSSNGQTFKYNKATPTIPIPEDMTLEAQLYSGLNEMWQNSNITYEWTRIFNNGIDNTIADGSTAKTFYYLGTSGVEGESDYKRFAQRLFVTHQAVLGKAVFQCKQTMTLDDASTLVFIDEYVITDVSDGKDAKGLDVSADKQTILYNVGEAEFAPTEVRLSAFQSNLVTGVVLFWYEETAPDVWTKLTTGVGGYTFALENYGSQLKIDTATVFAGNGSLEQKRYAVSTIDGDPTLNDNDISFTDFITIIKTDSSATSEDGDAAVFANLDNEAAVVILDESSLEPQADEILTGGRAQAVLLIMDGATPIVQGGLAGQYTVAMSTDNNDITAGTKVVGNNIGIFVATWLAGERNANLKATISYNTGDARGTILLYKTFSVTSTLDAEGGKILVIDSASGRYAFTPSFLSDITLNAAFYNDKLTPTLQPNTNYWYSWKVGSGSWETVKAGGGGTNGDVRVITRAEVRVEALVECRIFTKAVPTIPTDIIRATSITINDIQDGKTFRLYATDTSPFSAPSKPPFNIDPDVGNTVWKPTWATIVWAVDGTQRPSNVWATSTPEYDWSDPYQIGQEKGELGFSGGGYFTLYSRYQGTPLFPTANGNESSIAQMMAAASGNIRDWEAGVPNVDIVHSTTRLYQGYTGASDSLKMVNGVIVGTNGEAAVPVAGSVWTDPVKISAKDGEDNLNDGKTPYIQDGNWWIDGVDTGVKAEGVDGLAPAHNWNPTIPTELRFKNPNGSNGSYVDLKGEKGDAITVTVGSPPSSPSNGDIWITL